MSRTDGSTYAPAPVPAPVVGPGEFTIAAIGLDHGHIYGQVEGLVGAGAELAWVYDPDPRKVADFAARHPGVRIARSEAEVLDDPAVHLVAGAAVTSERCALGIRVMEAGKDYFTDKAPLTTLEQLAAAKDAVARTGRTYAVYYSERLHVETAVFASQLIAQGAIGRVLQVIGTGPHRLGRGRPDWFFDKERYGGILCDIGSHQIEQILHYTGASDGEVVRSQIANYHHPEHPGLDDFGDAMLVMDNGATGYFRCDWFTPDGLQTWGDGRTIILGTEGFIEQRKYMQLGDPQATGGHLYLANGHEETAFHLTGQVGYPYFGELVLDCLNRTENAMTQEHAFKAAELSVLAQLHAVDLTGRG
ncbi:Gfo/Idh/MocA family protein [Cellulomonas wangsupingiae]|uniref:Gfo/Idh/MocA family oxidoreductase n=1 Tax=Cellulomonas wangsupingiae TaxID=2968085 RepID=A0ABY5K945_9CELL|nr:Gfo/Idh/MocA family oxidoreductase [Cellulomonas wangsupingiae]MCC2333079.1 Gfo/Idh/MocA family oxidoreductase [Cellulomonas wangsupingiae]UUI66794.1 Gfo/Idh/MocA family oxidoreductase [Cellulomonas wangsupingiae]